ncbi:MAG: hypothetical protein FWD68_19680 [Alphaproteobacteria bacterium]|nr:hypothetical protein [Alphaproteobacteria bacterium]
MALLEGKSIRQCAIERLLLATLTRHGRGLRVLLTSRIRDVLAGRGSNRTISKIVAEEPGQGSWRLNHGPVYGRGRCRELRRGHPPHAQREQWHAGTHVSRIAMRDKLEPGMSPCWSACGLTGAVQKSERVLSRVVPGEHHDIFCQMPKEAPVPVVAIFNASI